jgi:ferredoxin-NADP reductase
MASKYVLVINKKHVFNPAAIAIFLLSLFGIGNGIWWVGSLILLPFVLILGLLVVRKIRRFHLFISFVISAVTVLVLFNLGNHMSPMESMKQSFTSWPLIFFGTIMLTEPLTAPARKNMQIIYGALVGVLFGAQFHIGLLNSSPEFALVVGNIFAYLVSSKQKLFLKLKSRREIGKDLYEFVFEKTNVFSYIPGQYMEWTLAGFRSDFRGNRRYFTIASSPTEQDIKLGVKITPDHASAFKKQLLKISPGFPMVADHLAGDFVLPEEVNKKLVFVAGGIGVTPFRSMIQYIIDTQQKRDIVLFYTAGDPAEFAYQDIFSEAAAFGVRTMYVITKSEHVTQKWNGAVGRIDKKMLTSYVPDYKDRIFFLSGPNVMVEGYKNMLKQAGVSGKQIMTDYFPGF